jgi:hypothetical protein
VMSSTRSISQSVFPRSEDGDAVFAADGAADSVGLGDGA